MAEFVVVPLDASLEAAVSPPSRKRLESRLLEHFMQYATEDVAYNNPGTPPIAMTFAALGHFFADSLALDGMTATGQQKFIERIAPPLGRNITWTDFKIILAMVAEKRFPREQQDTAMRQTVEDILLNLQLSSTAAGASTIAVSSEDLYKEAHEPEGETEAEDREYGKISQPRVVADHLRRAAEPTAASHQTPSFPKRSGTGDSRSASRLTVAASDVTSQSKKSVGTRGSASSPRPLASDGGYMPRAIYKVADPVLAFLSAGHSGEDMCRRLHLPSSAAGPFDALTSPQLNEWTPAQRLWRAIVQAAPAVFPTSSAVAAEELTFQLLLDRVVLLG
jgi:hypothetical protein